MKRTILLLTVAAIMAVMATIYSMGAFAEGTSETAPNCEQGIGTALTSDLEGALESTVALVDQLEDCAEPPPGG